MNLEWNNEQIERLTKLWSDGLTGGQIGAIFGVTRCAILGKVRRLGLPHRPKSGEASIKKIVAPPPPPPPPSPPEPDKPAIYGAYQAMLALSRGDCKYPIGHPNKPDFRFCTRSVKGELVYCEEHAKVCYRGYE